MTTRLLSTAALAVALAGCSTMQVRTEYDPKAPYPTYKTYTWMSAAPGQEQTPPMRDPGMRQYVVQVIDAEMKAKGLQLVKADANPDLLLWVHGWRQGRVEVSNYGYAYGGAYVYGPYVSTAVAMPVVDVHEYTEGTLLMDFVDAKTKQMVWRGTATDTVTSGDDIRRSVQPAVAKLLALYPPVK